MNEFRAIAVEINPWGGLQHFDPFFVVVDASRDREAREAVIGMDRNWHLLYVVYIERDNDLITIISARKATGEERKLYET